MTDASDRSMARSILFFAVCVWMALTWPAAAADTARVKCFSKEQQRAVVSSGRALALAKAIRLSKRRTPGEVVRALLCEDISGRLVYVLTVLPRSGKVTRIVVDALNGATREN